MTATRIRLTEDQTLDLLCALEDRDLDAASARVAERAHRSRRVSLSPDELIAVQVDLDHVEGECEWLHEL